MSNGLRIDGDLFDVSGIVFTYLLFTVLSAEHQAEIYGMVLHTKIPPDLLAFVFDASIMRLRLMNNDRDIRQPSEILHLDAVMILHAQLTVDKIGVQKKSSCDLFRRVFDR